MNINVKNLSILVHFMEGLNDPGFTMKSYRHACGTPACALGRAFGLFGKQDDELGASFAERVFGVDYPDLIRLFDSNLCYIIHTPQQWAAHCRAFLKKHGYEVEPQDDGFKAFMGKLMNPDPLQIWKAPQPERERR